MGIWSCQILLQMCFRMASEFNLWQRNLHSLDCIPINILRFNDSHLISRIILAHIYAFLFFSQCTLWSNVNKLPYDQTFLGLFIRSYHPGPLSTQTIYFLKALLREKLMYFWNNSINCEWERRRFRTFNFNCFIIMQTYVLTLKYFKLSLRRHMADENTLFLFEFSS